MEKYEEKMAAIWFVFAYLLSKFSGWVFWRNGDKRAIEILWFNTIKLVVKPATIAQLKINICTEIYEVNVRMETPRRARVEYLNVKNTNKNPRIYIVRATIERP